MDAIHNYEHEILRPDDRAIRKFLWSDYFHDSLVTGISFADGKNELTLSLQCDWECDQAYSRRHKGSGRPDYGEALRQEKYTYRLTFCGAAYYMQQSEDVAMPIYLNGRFKDTVRRRALETESERPLLHFRMQLTGGFADVIFQRVQVRKKIGRVSYCMEPENPPKQKVLSAQERARLRQQAEQDDTDDFVRFLALRDLNFVQDEALPELLRLNLHRNIVSEDASPYCAYLLGFYGGKDDLPLVRQAYFSCEDALQRQHIADAIERLGARK